MPYRPPILPFLLAGALAMQLGAQVVRGTVLSDGGRAVPGAEVRVSDSTGTAVDVRAGNRGEFFVRVAPGRYGVAVRRVGFLPANRGFFDLQADDTLTVDIALEMLPQRLRAVQVQSERQELKSQRVLGMSLKGLDVPILTPTEVAMAARGARTYLDIIRAAGMSGLAVSGDCVRSTHALRSECVLVLVDDIRVDDRENIFALAAPRTIDHIVYLKAAQATTLLGTGSPSGALFIYTIIGARIAR